LLNKKRDFIL